MQDWLTNLIMDNYTAKTEGAIPNIFTIMILTFSVPLTTGHCLKSIVKDKMTIEKQL